MTINHVHLASTDVAITQAFYAFYFGFRKECDHGAGMFLRDESGFLIALDPVAEQAEFPSWFHLGFCMPSEAAVLALHRKRPGETPGRKVPTRYRGDNLSGSPQAELAALRRSGASR